MIATSCELQIIINRAIICCLKFPLLSVIISQKYSQTKINSSPFIILLSSPELHFIRSRLHGIIGNGGRQEHSTPSYLNTHLLSSPGSCLFGQGKWVEIMGWNSTWLLQFITVIIIICVITTNWLYGWWGYRWHWFWLEIEGWIRYLLVQIKWNKE